MPVEADSQEGRLDYSQVGASFCRDYLDRRRSCLRRHTECELCVLEPPMHVETLPKLLYLVISPDTISKSGVIFSASTTV